MGEAKTYTYSWTCTNCDTQNQFERTKFQAAFDHRPKLPPCKTCGGSKSRASGSAKPDIDTELLEHWFKNPELFFMEQDEDLILSDTDLPILKQFLSNPENQSKRKRSIGPALAVKLHDEIYESENDKQWLIYWLCNNPKCWRGQTWGYIKKKIDPILKSN